MAEKESKEKRETYKFGIEENVFGLGYWLLDNEKDFFHGSIISYVRFFIWLIYSFALSTA
jgi:hypothetical protein